MLALGFPSFPLSHPYIVSAASPLIFSLKQGKGKGKNDFERITFLSMDLNRTLNTKHPVFSFNWWHSNRGNGWSKPAPAFQTDIVSVAYYPIKGKLFDYLKLQLGRLPLQALGLLILLCLSPFPLCYTYHLLTCVYYGFCLFSDSPGHPGSKDLCLFCSLLISVS